MPAGPSRLRPAAAALLSMVVMVPGGAAGQVRASELGTVSQIIDGTRIALEYSRPRARGRSELFGGEIKWNEVWTPGANFATTLDVSRDVKIDGHPVPKGKYSVWMVVRRGGTWTFVLDPRVRLYHEAHVDSTPAQIRFPVKIESSPFTEVLTWAFPANRAAGATLDLRWGRVRVPLDITVQPTYRLALTREQALPYLGTYDYRRNKMREGARPIALTLAWQDSMLVMRQVPKDEYYEGAALIRIREGWFIPGIFDQGKLFDALYDMVFEFTVANGKAVSFQVRSEADQLIGSGTRRP